MSDESPAEGPATDSPGPQASPKLTFRITRTALLAVAVLTLGVTPLAWARPWLLAAYLVPLVLLVWVLRLRTVVDSEALTTRTLLGGSRVGWDEVRSFRLDERRWLRAVLTSGKQVLLPAVRVRDLPTLSSISGGRLSDPTAQSPSESESSEPSAESSESPESQSPEPESPESPERNE